VVQQVRLPLPLLRLPLVLAAGVLAEAGVVLMVVVLLVLLVLVHHHHLL
jgi:hypothetical protein